METIWDLIPEKVSGKIFLIAVLAALVVGSTFSHC